MRKLALPDCCHAQDHASNSNATVRAPPALGGEPDCWETNTSARFGVGVSGTINLRWSHFTAPSASNCSRTKSQPSVFHRWKDC